MDALTRWCLYILTAYFGIVVVLVVCAFVVGLATRGVWRRTRALIEHTLGPRGEDDSDEDDEDDDGLTAILDATQEIRLGDAITEEIDMREFEAEFQLRRTIRPPWAIRDSYVMPEDFR